jgi:hypothetical protein
MLGTKKLWGYYKDRLRDTFYILYFIGNQAFNNKFVVRDSNQLGQISLTHSQSGIYVVQWPCQVQYFLNLKDNWC